MFTGAYARTSSIVSMHDYLLSASNEQPNALEISSKKVRKSLVHDVCSNVLSQSLRRLAYTHTCPTKLPWHRMRTHLFKRDIMMQVGQYRMRIRPGGSAWERSAKQSVLFGGALIHKRHNTNSIYVCIYTLHWVHKCCCAACDCRFNMAKTRTLTFSAHTFEICAYAGVCLS